MATEYPETMQDFMDKFGSEIACREYLASIRWHDGFVCPKCKHTEAWVLGRGLRKCKKCRQDVSVTAGTVFKESQIPLRLWFQAVWCVISQKQGVSALGLSRALGIKRQKTGWQLLRRIRTAMTRTSPGLLSGTVEVDEVFLGGVKPGKRGRGAQGKVLILVAVEDKGKVGIGRVRIVIIPDASSATLIAAIKTIIAPGSIIRTDQWPSYLALEKHGYKHKAVAHQSFEPGEDPTPLVHRIASLLKRWLLGTHQGGVQVGHIRSYLDEFVFRFNRRTSRSRGQLFYRLIQNMVTQK